MTKFWKLFSVLPMSSLSESIADVLKGSDLNRAAMACRRIVAVLRNEAHPVPREITENANRLLVASIELLFRDRHLRRQDEYVNLLTTLRFKTPDKHAANLLILPYSSRLLPVCVDAISDDPGGFTGEFSYIFPSLNLQDPS